MTHTQLIHRFIRRFVCAANRVRVRGYTFDSHGFPIGTGYTADLRWTIRFYDGRDRINPLCLMIEGKTGRTIDEQQDFWHMLAGVTGLSRIDVVEFYIGMGMDPGSVHGEQTMRRLGCHLQQWVSGHAPEPEDSLVPAEFWGSLPRGPLPWKPII